MRGYLPPFLLYGFISRYLTQRYLHHYLFMHFASVYMHMLHRVSGANYLLQGAMSQRSGRQPTEEQAAGRLPVLIHIFLYLCCRPSALRIIAYYIPFYSFLKCPPINCPCNHRPVYDATDFIYSLEVYFSG
jgi:hypothetical protein